MLKLGFTVIPYNQSCINVLLVWYNKIIKRDRFGIRLFGDLKYVTPFSMDCREWGSHIVYLAHGKSKGEIRGVGVSFSDIMESESKIFFWLHNLDCDYILFSRFLTILLLWILCVLLPLISRLLFSCVRYPVWDTHLLHGIPVPCSLC